MTTENHLEIAFIKGKSVAYLLVILLILSMPFRDGESWAWWATWLLSVGRLPYDENYHKLL